MQLNSSPDETHTTLSNSLARRENINPPGEDYTKNTLANAIYFIVICMWKLPTIILHFLLNQPLKLWVDVAFTKPKRIFRLTSD